MRRRLLIPVLLAVALSVLAVPALAQGGNPPTSPAPTPAAPPPDPLAQQLQKALQQRAAVDAAKQALAGQVAAAQDQQGNLSGLIVANRKTIEQTLQQMAVAEQHFHDASLRRDEEQQRADAARKQERTDRALLARFMTQSYMDREGFVTYLLSANDFQTLLQRSATLTHLQSIGGDLLQRVRNDVAIAVTNEKAAQADADTAAKAAADLARQRDDLTKQISDEQNLVDQLGAQASAAQQEIVRADSQDAALAQQIAALRIQQLDQLILQAEQAAWDEAGYYVQHHLLGLPPGTAIDPGHPAGVRFVWPVPGSTTSQLYGPSPYDFEPPYQGFPHFHTGIDLAAPMSTPIHAAGDGIVVAATASDVGYGNHIIIAHDGHTLTLYGHLQAMGVKVGDTVKQGQVIGLLGSTGNSTGPHTHFEVRVDGQPVDPGLFLPPLTPGAPGPPALPTPKP
ncbi:MAG TPA: M23 family metallopeptidase [Candidatus Angelobacter sp.]|nr:M23 family metallopeptidase [Candidatus Angelobacter sp.]